MKKIILILFCLVSTMPLTARELIDFHNKNFDPIGGNYCGLHLEVSKNALFVTYIIPPSESQLADCKGGGRNDYRNCDGFTHKLICHDNGICGDSSDEKNGYLTIELLEDGNIFSLPKGIKSIRSQDEEYFYCKK